MSTILDASRSCRVIWMSAADGDGSPDGWLWQITIPDALARQATRNTSLGCTRQAEAVPIVIRCRPRQWLRRFSTRTQKVSCCG